MTALLKGVIAYPGVLVRHWDLLWAFVWRELRSRYEGSLLGRLWPVLNPLILIAIYYVVFVQILQMKYGNRVDPDGYVPGLRFTPDQAMGLYLITGIVPWVMFSETIIRSASIIIEHANLIKKIAFPSELLVTYVVILNTIYFLIAEALFLLFLLLSTGSLPWQAAFLPLAILLQCLFTAGLGMFVGALNVFLRDTAQFVGLAVMLWMFLTPIFYPAKMATDKFHESAPWAEVIFKLNPMYHLMDIYRKLLLLINEPFPWQSIIIFAVFAMVMFILGLGFYRATKGRFADEV